jgi:hypothetical protein
MKFIAPMTNWPQLQFIYFSCMIAEFWKLVMLLLYCAYTGEIEHFQFHIQLIFG